MNIDLAQFTGVGIPVLSVAGIIGWLLKAYFDKRKDDREEQKAGRESETGIVETTGTALRIVREHMESLGKDMQQLRQEKDELKDELRAEREQRKEEVRQLKVRITDLERENNELKSLRRARGRS